MNRTKLMVAMIAAGLSLAGGAIAQGTSKDSYDMTVKRAQEAYKSDRAACSAMSGNAKDICMETAKGKEAVAKAEAEAAYKNTPKARESARVARADATYKVAKEKCDDLAGNVKDVCVKEAKAMHVKGKADAKVDRVASDASMQSADKTAVARRDAADDKRDADYKVAIEKCDALAGAPKDTCVRDAKTRFGKT
ncbi:MAG: hypothetical protein ABIO63_02225 [Casimicrobiaceae bacterium]